MADSKVRRKARSRTLEFLFGLEFTQDEWRAALDAYWDTFETRENVREYAAQLVKGIHEHREALDAAIDGALTNWTPERVGRIERNVLRIGAYEMLHVSDVPEKVAINEAIDLAKAYGSDESPGFVNAVLDRIKRTMTRESTA